MKRFKWQLRALAVLGVVGFIGFAYNRGLASIMDADRRVLPALIHPGNYLAIGALATTLYLLYVLIRHVRVEIRDRRLAAKLAIWGGSLLAHAVLATAVAGLIIAVHPDFPFGPTLESSAASPSGDRVAYLYRTGLLCSYAVFVRDTGDAELRKIRDIPRDRCEQRPRVVWTGDGEIEVLGDAGEPLGPQYWDLSLGPH